jgi:hypothetical protein
MEPLPDPMAPTGYHLCVYDSAQGEARAAFAFGVPAERICRGKPCWKSVGTGLRWSRRSGPIERVQVEPKRILVKLRDLDLEAALPLAHDPDVLVQFGNKDACWEASFIASGTKIDTDRRFEATSR